MVLLITESSPIGLIFGLPAYELAKLSVVHLCCLGNRWIAHERVAKSVVAPGERCNAIASMVWRRAEVASVDRVRSGQRRG